MTEPDVHEEDYERGRAYSRLGRGTVSLKLGESVELGLNGEGLALAFLLVVFGPVPMVLVGGYMGLPVYAIMIMSGLVVLALLLVIVLLLAKR